MFAKWRAQHSHNTLVEKGGPLEVWYGSFGFASARFSSVRFSWVGSLLLLLLLAIWLWGGACCVRLCCCCCHCHWLWLGIVCFAIISTHATTASTTCYRSSFFFSVFFFLYVYNGNMHVSNYGAQKPAKQLQQQLWNNRKLLLIQHHHHRHHRGSEWWTTKCAKCESCSSASSMQKYYSHRKWKYSWGTRAEYKTKGWQKKKKRQPNAFFHLQSTHSWYLGMFLSTAA